jgi:signal transduction histidine kinase
MNSTTLQFVIGKEKTLSQLLRGDEIAALLRVAVAAGASFAQLKELDSAKRWCCPEGAAGSASCSSYSAPISIEGEVVGEILLQGSVAVPVEGLLKMLAEAVKLLIHSSFQRQLTSEVHTTTIEQSYAELMDSHGKLQQSEQKYRDLAANLEITVQQRSAELEQTYLQLVQSEKMACVGQLAAGVAHEINTPLGFITSNLNSLKKYLDRLLQMDATLEQLVSQLPAATSQPVFDLKKKLKIDFIREDAAELIDQSLDGAGHVTTIVADLKKFSHIDSITDSALDLNAELDRALTVLSSQLPASVVIRKEYKPLPALCLPAAAISQIFFNLLLNAIEAGGANLQLNLTSQVAGDRVVMQILDNGPGIPAAIRSRVCEPFFTTKEIGQGSGMGLALVHQMLRQLGGNIEISCPASGGTLVNVSLPMEAKHE